MYRLLIDLEVLQLLDAMPKRLRSRLLQHFDAIRKFPRNYCDYHETDSVGRRVEISIASGYAIHFWIDHADKHVKVLVLNPAGS